MRALIFELRPEALREEGLAAAIRKQAEGVSARTEIAVEVRLPKKPITLAGDVEEQVYRVVQEALANIAKHSRARNAVVHLRRAPNGHQLIVEVIDDGVGFDQSLPQPGHMGLRTMAQRMEQLGGSVMVDTSRGRGTRIAATIPLPRRSTPLSTPSASPVAQGPA
jgi:signal transduction histidine kinase